MFVWFFFRDREEILGWTRLSEILTHWLCGRGDSGWSPACSRNKDMRLLATVWATSARKSPGLGWPCLWTEVEVSCHKSSPWTRWSLYTRRCRRWGRLSRGWWLQMPGKVIQRRRDSWNWRRPNLRGLPRGLRVGGNGDIQISKEFPSRWKASHTDTEHKDITVSLSVQKSF